MKILLIRHGEAEEEGGDSSLTSQGIEQAKQVAEVLKNYSIDKIYVSK